MARAWHGPTLSDDTINFGPLALIAPLLQRLDIAAIIDRHLPPDPQLAFSHGHVLSLLLAARLCQPTALINVPAWAEDTGADLLWYLPAASLNDDRTALRRSEHIQRPANPEMLAGVIEDSNLRWIEALRSRFVVDAGVTRPAVPKARHHIEELLGSLITRVMFHVAVVPEILGFGFGL